MPAPYISELSYAGSNATDFIEIVVDAGTDVSNISIQIYDDEGELDATISLGALVSSTGSSDIYVIDTSTSGFGGLAPDESVALVVGGSAQQFLSFGGSVTAEEGAANGATSTNIGTASAGQSLETTDGGTSYATQTTPNSGSIPCFTAGTRILTPNGECPVEALRPGDLVTTLDHGPVPLRWVGQCHVGLGAMARAPRQRPVLIPAGSLGPGLPMRDLYVSRQHRMLARSSVAARMFGAYEVLLPAIKLTSWPGIRITQPDRPVTYLHLFFDCHEVLFAEGAPTESLLLGAQATGALDPGQLRDLASQCPRALDRAPVAARPLVETGKHARHLLERVSKNNKPLVEPSPSVRPLVAA